MLNMISIFSVAVTKFTIFYIHSEDIRERYFEILYECFMYVQYDHIRMISGAVWDHIASVLVIKRKRLRVYLRLIFQQTQYYM